MTQVKVTGSEALLARLEEVARRIENPAVAEGIQQVFAERLRRRFEAEGEGDWPEHRAGTQRLRPGGRRMHDTGALEQAITSGRVQREQSAVRYTAEMPFYGALLDTRATLPPFPIIRDQDQQLADELVDALRRYIEETR